MSNTIVIDVKSIPNHVIVPLCRPLVGIIEKYYQNPDHVTAYIEWHTKKYGCLPSNIDDLKIKMKGMVT